MRQFVQDLQGLGWGCVTLAIADRLGPALAEWIATHQLTEVWILEPSDRPFRAWIDTHWATWTAALPQPCASVWVPSNLFLWSEAELAAWFGGRQRWVLEDFYREGRRRFGVLMDGAQPVGDRWNFDRENRKPPKRGLHPPEPPAFVPNATVQAVIDRVRSLRDQGQLQALGSLEPFRWATTRSQARQALDHFITVRLGDFGPYQDAMVTGQDTLWHALLSPYLNLGLLHPQEVIAAAEQAGRDRPDLPLNSLEGFIRQVLGWREYLRGTYLEAGDRLPDDYRQRNGFNHDRPLPAFFWDGNTEMNCLHQTLDQVWRTGYAHHIQRLMVLANFALIAGLQPQAVEQWFHSAFIDAYDWVMQTNVLGMGIFADGGFLATKPYAASANYINKMSDYCRACVYNPRDRTGPQACPFNYFYWDFLQRHADKLRSQGRMTLVLKHLERMEPAELAAIATLAAQWHTQHASAPAIAAPVAHPPDP
jgi:deoxyribodipyrimidine photolyase-related protein